MSETSPEMSALKSRLKSTWMAGDYGHFSKYLEAESLKFLSRLNIAPGTRMLDVACGAGQISIPAAFAGANVTGVDIATNLIEQARARAQAENVPVRFDEGDAEDLPYEDGTFDLVVSLIGAIFAPRPERVAAELLRVCRSGGRIVMANWTPEGHVGQMFKVIGKYVPPPPLMAPPMKWGEEATIRERLGDGLSSLNMTRRMFSLNFPFSPAEVVELFRVYYGPTNRAFAALDEEKRNSLRLEMEQLWTENNRASDGSTQVEGEYLLVEGIRR
jgi:SAM-dependent methyltransferase